MAYTTGVVTATIADTRVSDLLGSSPLLDAGMEIMPLRSR